MTEMSPFEWHDHWLRISVGDRYRDFGPRRLSSNIWRDTAVFVSLSFRGRVPRDRALAPSAWVTFLIFGKRGPVAQVVRAHA